MTTPAFTSLPKSNPRGWTHYILDEWFDRSDIRDDPNLERLGFRLERIAREKPYAITTNEELMEALGITRNTLAALLNRYEAAGWGKRVLVPGGHGQATGRLGFVLFIRPTNRPVGSPDTFDQIVKMMHADIKRSKSRPRTVPFAPPEPDRSPIFGERGPQFLGSDGPQFLGSAHCSKDEVTAQETTTTGPESSSFLTPSIQNQEPERPSSAEPLGSVPSDLIPADACTHVEAEDPPSVPELPPELAAQQAILAVIIARFAAFFGKTLDQARAAVVSLFGEFRAKAKIRGIRFEPEWIGDALEATEQAKAAQRIKKGTPWTYFLGILENHAKRGLVRDGPTCHQAQQTLDELASYGQTIVIKPDGSVAHGRTRADACPWEELPGSLRRKVKEQKDPILAIVRARASCPPTENARL